MWEPKTEIDRLMMTTSYAPESYEQAPLEWLLNLLTGQSTAPTIYQSPDRIHPAPDVFTPMGDKYKARGQGYDLNEFRRIKDR